jgi:hypothetical protein
MLLRLTSSIGVRESRLMDAARERVRCDDAVNIDARIAPISNNQVLSCAQADEYRRVRNVFHRDVVDATSPMMAPSTLIAAAWQTRNRRSQYCEIRR